MDGRATLTRPIAAYNERRCERKDERRRQRSPHTPRPSDMIVAHYVPAIGFMLAGGLVAIMGVLDVYTGGRWLPLHLLLVGGVSQLVVATSQFFAAAFFSTDMPTRQRVRTQLVLWNAGAVLLVAGVQLDSRVLIDAGSTTLAIAIGMVLASLRHMQKASLQKRPVMIRWYYTCCAWFFVGVVLGVTLTASPAWTSGDLLAAHIAVMLGGWLGTAIVGTLHTFFPSLTNTMLRLPRLEQPTYWLWTLGIAALASGFAFGIGELSVVGWAALAAAAGLLSANVIGTARAGNLGALPATLVSAGQLCLVAGLVLAAVVALSNDGAAPTGNERAAIGTLLLFGWVAMTVMGAMLRLLAVIGRVRNLALEPPKIELGALLVVPALLGVASLSAVQLTDQQQLWTTAATLLAATYAVIGARVLALAVRAARAARLDL
jgi:nitrite reductase (NO-forming)